MNFALFIGLNAILLIRPEDFRPELAGLRLYLIVIVLNVLTSLPKIVAILQYDELLKRPVTVCVLGLLGSIVLSLVDRGRFGAALDFAAEFLKVVVYYLLFLSVVDTPARLRAFLGWLVVLAATLALLGLLQFHEVIDYEVLRPIEQADFDPETGLLISYPRLCGAGLFHDPNDLCLILTIGVVCCLYRAATAGNFVMIALWLLPIGVFGYAMVLTKSRGGLLGLVGALGALAIAKFGWRRALPVVVVGLPIMVLAVGGRQANIGVGSGDTGQQRIMFWAEGFTAVGRSPITLLTGIGAGEYEDVAGHVAHNSYVHAYVELGLVGGTMFLAAFILAMRMLYRVCRTGQSDLPRGLAPLAPFLFALVVGYGIGMYSLSRNYIVPTYLCLGAAATYLTMAMPRPATEFRISSLWLKQTVTIGVGGVLFLRVFTMVAGRLG